MKEIELNRINVAENLQAIDIRARRLNDNSKHNDYRGNYQLDRDRILYTTSFRRLVGKTQIFSTGMGEHYRNRLTHTLQVMQIATTISKYLGLNIELTEAIALGHDIGHAPFGHVGERTLNNIMNNCDILDKYGIRLDKGQRGFKHNLQGLRVLCDIEKKNRKYNGLDITTDTLWGIVNHSAITAEEKCNKIDIEHNRCLLKRDRQNFPCSNKNDDNIPSQSYDYYDKYLNEMRYEPWSFEGFVVNHADEIAQRHHDIEDGIISDIFEPMEFIRGFKNFFKDNDYYSQEFKAGIKKIEKEIKEKEIIENDYLLPILSSFIVDFYIENYISATAVKLEKCIKEYSLKTNEDFYRNKEKIRKENNLAEIMDFEENFSKQDSELKKLLKNMIINSQKAQLMDGKGTYIIRQLFEAYLTTPNQLPDNIIKNFCTDCGLFKRGEKATKYEIGYLRNDMENTIIMKDKLYLLCRNICDYISSMTDRYALKQHEKLYGSKYFSK